MDIFLAAALFVKMFSRQILPDITQNGQFISLSFNFSLILIFCKIINWTGQMGVGSNVRTQAKVNEF